MAALNNVALVRAGNAQGLSGLPWDVIRQVVGRIVWAWVAEHENDTVTKIRVKLVVVPLRITVKVRDCEWLLRALFGPPPAVLN